MNAKVDFGGFPEASIQFLEALRANNEKPWFEQNKGRYKKDLLAPSVEFVASLGKGLRQIAPDISVDTRTNGSGTLMRIYRDTRFSQDKTPYKTNVSGLYWQGTGKKTEHPAFGFQLGLDGLQLMAGQFAFTKSQLAQYRTAVMEEASGKALVEAVTAVTEASNYEVAGKHYKRTPRGFDPEHERAEWLQYNGLYVHPIAPVSLDVVCSPKIVSTCLEHFQKMSPLFAWLTQSVP